MTFIVALSGKKQAGKNTVADYIYSIYNNPNLGIIRAPETPTIKLYSFADKLKQFCIECLGLTRAQCYGDDEDKNTLTALRWENMPGIIAEHNTDIYWSIVDEDGYLHNKVIIHEPGCMTAREVMQYFGTNIGRKMYPNIWVDATIRQIKKDDKTLAIITDCRFPNEVNSVLSNDGIVVRLTRNINNDSDEHESEKVLDKDRFDWNLFTHVVDNHNMSIEKTNQVVLEIMELYEKQAFKKGNQRYIL